MTGRTLQLAFITGRSCPDNPALSPVQLGFISNLLSGGVYPVTVNFPWPVSSLPYTTTGLLRASLNNAREYLNSRRPSFAARYRTSLIALTESAEHTLFLSGSCGLELFNNLNLPASLMSRVSIFAYGPVARRRPDCRHQLIQGKQDWISRFWFRRADKYIRCGHMNYLSQPELAELCKLFIKQIREQKN